MNTITDEAGNYREGIAATADPPSEFTFPPLFAVLVVMLVAPVVLTAGREVLVFVVLKLIQRLI